MTIRKPFYASWLFDTRSLCCICSMSASRCSTAWGLDWDIDDSGPPGVICADDRELVLSGGVILVESRRNNGGEIRKDEWIGAAGLGSGSSWLLIRTSLLIGGSDLLSSGDEYGLLD